MDALDYENLVLIEFLVDKICFDQTTTKTLVNQDGEICVSFQFFDNVPICISEEDFMPKCPGDVTFVKRGKSCLFSLTPNQVKTAMQEFNINVEVYTKVDTDKTPIGEATIPIVEMFVDLMNNITSGMKSLRDFYPLYSKDNCCIGSIGVYIRLSCFGKQIVTQFHVNVENKSVEFKANQGHYLFKYCKSEKSEKDVQLLPDNNQTTTTVANNQRPSCCDIAQENYSQSPSSIYSIVNSTCSQATCLCQYQPPPPVCLCQPINHYKPSPPPPFKLAFAENFNENPNEGNYQEIETQMGDCGGIKVRLHEDPEMEEKAECACVKPSKVEEKPCGGVCVISPDCKAKCGKADEIIDSPEMYVLRVGTRKETMTKRNNVDLEFCTPIPRQKPPRPITDTKRMQYDPADLKGVKNVKEKVKSKEKKK